MLSRHGLNGDNSAVATWYVSSSHPTGPRFVKPARLSLAGEIPGGAIARGWRTGPRGARSGWEILEGGGSPPAVVRPEHPAAVRDDRCWRRQVHHAEMGCPGHYDPRSGNAGHLCSDPRIARFGPGVPGDRRRGCQTPDRRAAGDGHAAALAILGTGKKNNGCFPPAFTRSVILPGRSRKLGLGTGQKQRNKKVAGLIRRDNPVRRQLAFR